MNLPGWLTEGLPVLVFGIGTVAVTLFILSQVIGLFGRVASRTGAGDSVTPSGGGKALAAGTTQPASAGGRRELLRAAAVAAAIEAYRQAEKAEGSRVAARPARTRRPTVSRNSPWAAAGRSAQMDDRRRTITGRKGPSPR